VVALLVEVEALLVEVEVEAHIHKMVMELSS